MDHSVVVKLKTFKIKFSKKAVLSQGLPRNTIVDFDMYRQRHRAVSLPEHGFLVGLCLQTADNGGLLSKVSEEVATETANSVIIENPTVV